MKPAFDVFGISIKSFGVVFALGFLACGLLVARRLRELGKPVDWAYEIVFAALIGGLVGARGYFVVQNYGEVKGHLFKSVFSGSGLVWYGGVIGGAIGVLLWMRWRDQLRLMMLDMCATALALGYAIGRIGCQVSGDGDYGIRSSLPWAMGYPHGTVPTPPGVTVQPTPIYETVAMGLVAYLLWHLRDRVRPGVVFALYCLLSGFERFLVEFIRRNREVLFGLTAPQLESVGLMIVGVVWLSLMTRGGRGLSGLRAEGASGGAGSSPRVPPPPDLGPTRDNPRRDGHGDHNRHRGEPRAGVPAGQPHQRAGAPGGGRVRHDRAGARVWHPDVCGRRGRPARPRARVRRGAVGATSGYGAELHVLFASKAFPCTAVLRTLAQEGLWCDVASGGEMHLALQAGFAPERLVLHGNAKSEAELRWRCATGWG